MSERIIIKENIFQTNEDIAGENLDVFNKAQVFCINLISSPGAGKTSLVERTVKTLSKRFKVTVINGDLATQLDRDRAEAAGALAININTGGECHLDAHMIKKAIADIDLMDQQLIIIENVGNLICPVSFKLGAHKLIVIASVPEGDDKPHKYPGTFLEADVIVLNKVDLLPYVPFDKEKFINSIALINPQAKMFEVSCLQGKGIDQWCEWLSLQIQKSRSA